MAGGVEPLLVGGTAREVAAVSRRTALAPRSLRRYWRLCDARPPGSEPQCWEADTEIGEAWRALPLPIRLGLLLRVGAVNDLLWELPRLTRASVERGETLAALADIRDAVVRIAEVLEKTRDGQPTVPARANQH